MAMKLSSQSSESLVLGGLINNLEWILEFTDLKANYFSIDVNKIIFAALKKLYKNGSTSCDIIDIYALVETNPNYLKQLEDYGGIDYITTLSQLAEGKELNDIEAHVKTIIDCAYKNELNDTLIGLTEYVEKNTDKSKEYINKIVEGELLDLKSKYGSSKKAEMLSSKLDKIIARIDSIQQDGYIGIPTSIPLLNKFVTYQKGELVVFGAPAKFGKSQFVVNEAYWLAVVNKVPVMILDTELETDKFVLRMAARITGYSFGFIASGEYKKHPKCKQKVERAFAKIAQAPISHTYIVGWCNDEILNEVKRMKIQHNIQILFFDYIKVENVDSSIKEHDVLGNMTNFLKNQIAGALDMAVVALAQLSDYKDMGMRLANSQKIKNYSSTVIYMTDKTKEEYADSYNELGGNVKMFVAYNRNGTQMNSEEQDKGINISFNKKNATVLQADYQYPEIIELSQEEDYDIEEFQDDLG